jgi:oligosaccharide repeat unit polymerase
MILLVSFLVILAVCYHVSKTIVLTPQFCFTLCFLPGIIYAFFYIDTWNINFSPLTLFILIGGTAVFSVVSITTSYILSRCSTKRGSIILIPGIDTTPINHKQYKIKPSLLLLICYTIVQLFTIYMLYRYIMSLSGRGSISDAIYYFRHERVFSNRDIDVPGYLGFLKYFCYSSGYLISYILIHSLVYRYKCWQPLLIFNIAISLGTDLLFGARTGSMQMLVAIALQFYIVFGKKYGWKIKLDRRIVLVALIAVVALVISFKSVGNLLGRGTERETDEYLSVYISAELKNLDIFVRNGKFGAGFSECQTMIYVVNYMGAKLGHPEWIHGLDLPFRSVNGHTLGNVYTIFYAFLYDGGILGVLFYSALMAVLCQIAFHLSLKERDNSKVDIWVVIYSYFGCALVFSFFSNTFYELVFNNGFIKFLTFWMILKLAIDHLHFRAPDLHIPKIKISL